MTEVIADHIYQLTVKQTWSGQAVYNVFTWRVDGSWPGVEVEQFATAWWNHIKTQWRAMLCVEFGNVFEAVQYRDLSDETGAYGEWPIPLGERVGTRSGVAAPTTPTTFAALGVRLAVGSRLTRPGQKRFMGVTETDLTTNTLSTALLTLCETLAGRVSAPAILGDPAIGLTCTPVVVSVREDEPFLVSQEVIGFVVNPFVTSQVSRKAGRGI